MNKIFHGSSVTEPTPIDVGKLKEMGAAEVFIPGTPIKNIADFIKKKFAG